MKPSHDARPPHASKVLILTPQFPPATFGGGPSRTLAAMVQQCREPARASVVTSDTDHRQDRPMEVERNRWTSWQGVPVWYGSTGTAHGYLRALIAARKRRPRIIYLNSLFHLRFSILPLLLNKVRFWGDVTFILAPRGELDPGALRRKAVKKKIFLGVARMVRLHKDLYWHVSSKLEAENVGRLRVNEERILIKENETSLPPQAVRYERLNTRAELVYMGRISPKKQLELLIVALSKISGDFRLRVIGSSDDLAYEKFLHSQSAPLGERVQWLGHLSHAEIFQHLDECTVACFPTAAENFGHAIAEALSRSCPVLIADVTPWTSVVKNGGGILVPAQTEAAWIESLRQIIDAPETWSSRHRSAAKAYEEWREGSATSSFLDYMIDGSYAQLAVPQNTSHRGERSPR